MGLPVLYQLPMDHGCEIAAWALDHHALPHLRRTLRPGWHLAEARAKTGQSTLPCLVDDGRPFVGPLAIAKHLDIIDPERQLGCTDPAVSGFCEELLAELGPAVARVWYGATLTDPGLCVAVYGSGLSTARKAAYRVALAPIRRAMLASWGLPGRLNQAHAILERWLDRLASGPGGPFDARHLVAAGALSYLLGRPYGPFYLPDPLPEAAAAVRARYADHPAIQWASHTYGTHRGVSMAENHERRGADVL